MISKYDMSDEEYTLRVNKLKDMARDLHQILPVLDYKLCVIKGNNVINTIERISRSWNRNAYNMAVCIIHSSGLTTGTFGPGVLNLKNTAGTTVTSGYGSMRLYGSLESVYGYYGAISTLRGIVVGSSDASENFEGWSLGSIISSGTGSGQLSYQESRNPTIAYNSGTREYTVTWSRYFNNNSSGNVTVKEIGLYAYVHATTTAVMVARDTIVPSIVLEPSGQLYTEYNIRLVFPG